MAQHKRADQEKIDELEEEKRHRKKAQQPLYDQLKAADEGAVHGTGLVVEPSADAHAALLADVHSDEQRASLVTQLQQSYGNAYVQRVMERIQAERGSGQPLEAQTRSEMEGAFGQDFSDVRIHTDTEANRLSKELGAKAFTTRKDIFFGEGAYQPGSATGKGLLAHELTHVLQQESAIQAGEAIGQVGDTWEQEATWVGQAVSKGHEVSIDTASAVPALQRQVAEAQAEVEAPAAKDPVEEAKSQLTWYVDQIATAVERENIKGLLRWAADLQQLGFEGEAKAALDEAAKKAAGILERKIAAFDAASATEEMAADLVKAAADVQLIPGDETATEASVESALDKVLAWAMDQLNAAVDRLNREKLEGTPTDETCRLVLKNLGRVQLLGGEDVEEVTIYVSALLEESRSSLLTAGEEEAGTTEQAAG